MPRRYYERSLLHSKQNKDEDKLLNLSKKPDIRHVLLQLPSKVDKQVSIFTPTTKNNHQSSVFIVVTSNSWGCNLAPANISSGHIQTYRKHQRNPTLHNLNLP